MGIPRKILSIAWRKPELKFFWLPNREPSFLKAAEIRFGFPLPNDLVPAALRNSPPLLHPQMEPAGRKFPWKARFISRKQGKNIIAPPALISKAVKSQWSCQLPRKKAIPRAADVIQTNPFRRVKNLSHFFVYVSYSFMEKKSIKSGTSEKWQEYNSSKK